MRKSHSSGATMWRAGLASGATVAAVLAMTAAPAFAEAKLTLSAASGPSGGGNTITAQAPSSGTAPFAASAAPTVEFQAITATVTQCTASYKTVADVAVTSGAVTAGVADASTNSGTVTKINNYRIAIKVPTKVITGSGVASTKFNICAYDGVSTTTSTLLASASYTVAAKPTITGITPTSGPALGGYPITVSGTGFTTGSTATLGNAPLTGVTVNAAGTLLTGIAPPNAASTNVPLVVTTLGGAVNNTNDPGGTGSSSAITLTSTNGIVVTPNTSPSGSVPLLDIQGVGFNSMDFANAAAKNNGATLGAGIDANFAAASVTVYPHIVLVSKSTGYAAAAAGTGRPITLCMNITVLSDVELLCSLDLAESLDVTAADTAGATTDVPSGVYSVQIIQDGAALGTPLPTSITSGSTFTVSAY